MTPFDIRDPDFEANVRRSFGDLTLMHTIGARLLNVTPGEVEIDLPFREDLTQHHGFLAAPVLTAIIDVACGYAAMTLMPPGVSVLTVEYKVNFLSPARGDRVLARGRVVRPGRTVTVCAGDVLAIERGSEKLVATMLATMATAQSARRDAPATQAHSATARDDHAEGHRSNEPPRRSRAWCVCRGGRLRQRVKDFVGVQ